MNNHATTLFKDPNVAKYLSYLHKKCCVVHTGKKHKTTRNPGLSYICRPVLLNKDEKLAVSSTVLDI